MSSCTVKHTCRNRPSYVANPTNHNQSALSRATLLPLGNMLTRLLAISVNQVVARCQNRTQERKVKGLVGGDGSGYRTREDRQPRYYLTTFELLFSSPTTPSIEPASGNSFHQIRARLRPGNNDGLQMTAAGGLQLVRTVIAVLSLAVFLIVQTISCLLFPRITAFGSLSRSC